MTNDNDQVPPVILLRKEAGGRWRAEVPDLLSAWQSDPADIDSAANQARMKVGGRTGVNLKLKVAEETDLTADEVLELIDVHGDAAALDLSLCDLSVADLGRDWVRQKREEFRRNYPTYPMEPPWYSLTTDGINLNGVRLDGANLTAARLNGADLWGASLRGARLYGANLRETQISLAVMDGVITLRADLRNSDISDTSLVGVSWYGSSLDRTRMGRLQLGRAILDETWGHSEKTTAAYVRAAEAYLGLKNNFNSIGRYEDAAWANVKEQRMKKAALWRELKLGKIPRRIFGQSFIPWSLNWLWDLLAGYGETPQKPLAWAGGLAVLFFPLVYWAIGALPGHGAAFTSASLSDIDWAGWGDSLIFSLTSFGTLSFSRLQPEGTLPNLIAAFEAMIGVLLFALFVFTLGNRMSRS